jgi:hypothetical protein
MVRIMPSLSRFLLCGAACWALAVTAEAGGACHACRGGMAGATTPCGDTGCGPRYCGEKHEPSRPDPCDACNRWRGCNGAREMPEMLAPWQLPPGRGFQPAAAFGYRAGPCRTCGPSGSFH